ncbi:unnamed protein product [Amoebophrya sp. A25]|nr:unnamed protein product [Amoebophrya sp. A25]|eukprot:GSA25T00006728001.1
MSRFVKVCAVAAVSVEGIMINHKHKPHSPGSEAHIQEELERFKDIVGVFKDQKCKEDVRNIKEACPGVEEEKLKEKIERKKFKKAMGKLVRKIEAEKKGDYTEYLQMWKKELLALTEKECCPKDESCCGR